MNVYDFDKTIYDGDSTAHFYFFCLKQQPKILFFLPKQLFFFIKYLFGIIDKTKFKENFYCFFCGIPDIDLLLSKFWAINLEKIKKWYLNSKKDDDLIISASPEFLLRPACEKLGIKNLIASKVDKKTGKYDGLNCFGEEKVKRYKSVFANTPIMEFYSDSLSDSPLAEIAKSSFFVIKDKIIPWSTYSPTLLKRFKTLFLSKEFIMFFLIGVINTFNGIFFAYIYSAALNPNLSFILGYITSLSISYLLNSFLTFRESLGIGKYIKFCISYIPNFIIQNAVVLLLYNHLNFDKLIAYSLAALIGVFVTFLAVKFFVFKKN